MGNFQSSSCCQDTRTKQTQLQTSYQRQIQMLNNKDYRQFKREFDNINLLAEIDFNIREIKSNRTYFQVIHDHFQSVDAFVDFIDSDVDKPILTVIQSKAFHQTNNRYDQINNRNLTYQHAIVNVNEFATQKNNTFGIGFENIPSQSLNKIKLLQRDRQIIKQDCIEFLTQMHLHLISIDGFNDRFWDFQIKESLDNMAFHLYYNLNRYIHFLNTVISMSDTVSYLKIKQLYHFILKYFCKTSFSNLTKQYFCQIKVMESEIVLYKVGNAIVATNFMPFSPYEEIKQNEDSNRNGMEQPIGDRDSENKVIRFILNPLSHSQQANKFRHFQHLFYMPFSLFQIKKIQSGDLVDVIYLEQIKSQYLIHEVQLINELKSLSSINHVSINEQNLLNELISLRNTINESITSKYKQEQSQLQHENIIQTAQSRKKLPILQKISKDYYLLYLQCYQQRKVHLQKQNQNLPIQSNKHLELAEEQIKVKIQDTTTEQQPQIQKQSILQLIEVKKQKLQQNEKILHKYIKKHSFQKLQNQIDNIDHFVYLSSLNMSQCWLEKIQHMEMFPNLKELYLYSNLLNKIQGLQNNSNLRLLSLSRNHITKIENIEHLVNLKSFYITKNELNLNSAQYLCSLPLAKLQLLAISFKQNPDNCFELLLKRIPPKLKKLTINEADNLTNRCKNNLKKKLKKAQVQFFSS